MFGTFFKASLKALPILILFPILALVIFAWGVDNYLASEGTVYVGNTSWDKYDGEGEGLLWMIRSMIIAIISNFIFLMIIPPLFGGIKASTKQKQFYVGFFVNLIFMLLIPIFLHSQYVFNGLLLGIEVVLHTLSFLFPFILGARFVAPAYRRGFWFAY